jgi:hypothetical protein
MLGYTLLLAALYTIAILPEPSIAILDSQRWVASGA